VQFKTRSHGFTVGIERVDSEFYLSLKAIGELTHRDYETIIPMIEMALGSVKEPKVKALLSLLLTMHSKRKMLDKFTPNQKNLALYHSPVKEV